MYTNAHNSTIQESNNTKNNNKLHNKRKNMNNQRA